MNFSKILIEAAAEKHLLKHEFYQAWNEGKISMETLRLYAKQYYSHVKAFPRYISATHSNCQDIGARQILLENLIDEEKGNENHPELWMRFAEGLGATRADVENSVPMPEIQELVDSFLGFSKSSYAEGLGALFAYEHQVPEIARFKIDALMKHYEMSDPATLKFFRVHQDADVYHTQAMTQLIDQLPGQDREKCLNATRVTANQLWKFLDGIYQTTK